MKAVNVARGGSDLTAGAACGIFDVSLTGDVASGMAVGNARESKTLGTGVSDLWDPMMDS